MKHHLDGVSIGQRYDDHRKWDNAFHNWLLGVGQINDLANEEWLRQYFPGGYPQLAAIIRMKILEGARLSADCHCHDPEDPTPEIPPISQASPIILDLNGDGIGTTTTENGAHFDHEGDRFAEKSAWVDSNDALLVWDRDGNGQIDDGGELFGNNYTLQDGTKAANGFEALKEFDSNGDGVVDAIDERWSELQLWQDRNGNGVVDDGELLTMEEAGVAGLHTGHQDQEYTDENGNQHSQSGSFIKDDGTTGQMNDVWFQTDSIDTKYLDEIAISDDIGTLPNLRGWGEVPSLHQAMALDGTGRLQALVERFVAADPATAKTLVWDIIFAWTGVTDLDPASRGQHVDAQMLTALERLTGQEYRQRDHGTNIPGSWNAQPLQDYFDDWHDRVTSYLLLSVQYNDLYKLVAKTAGADGAVGYYVTVLDQFKTLYQSDPDRLKDFFRQLNRYDTRGTAFFEAILRDGAGYFTDADYAFRRDVMLAFYGSVAGSAANDVVNYNGRDSATVAAGGDGDDRVFGGKRVSNRDCIALTA